MSSGKKKWENPEQNRPRLSLQAVKMFMQVSCQWQRRWEEERRWSRWNSNRIANNNNITQPGQAKRPKRQKGQKAAGLTLVRIPLSSAPSRYRYRSFPHLIINCNSCRAKARSARWFPKWVTRSRDSYQIIPTIQRSLVDNSGILKQTILRSDHFKSLRSALTYKTYDLTKYALIRG